MVLPFAYSRRVGGILAAALVAHRSRDRGDPDPAVALVQGGIVVERLASMAILLGFFGLNGTGVLHWNPVSHFRE
jgi:hypothetical protein